MLEQAAVATRLAAGRAPIAHFSAHTGHDSFTEAAALELFERAAGLDLGGPPLLHETHRGRCLSNAWASARIAAALGPRRLRIIADFSHFLCAAEAEPWDEALAAPLAALLPHVAHIHGRVGYENGPQIPDSRAPGRRWARHVAQHEAWWSDIWARALASGGELPSATPEAGPPTYQHTLPGSDEPTADFEATNDAMAARLEEVCARQVAAASLRL